MDRVNAVFFGERHDSLEIEIRLDRSFPFSDQVCFIGLKPVETEAVFVGKHGDGANLQFVSGAENADSNFAAIQGQKFFYSHGDESPMIFFRARILRMASSIIAPALNACTSAGTGIANKAFAQA